MRRSARRQPQNETCRELRRSPAPSRRVMTRVKGAAAAGCRGAIPSNRQVIIGRAPPPASVGFSLERLGWAKGRHWVRFFSSDVAKGTWRGVHCCGSRPCGVSVIGCICGAVAASDSLPFEASMQVMLDRRVKRMLDRSGSVEFHARSCSCVICGRYQNT